MGQAQQVPYPRHTHKKKQRHTKGKEKTNESQKTGNTANEVAAEVRYANDTSHSMRSLVKKTKPRRVGEGGNKAAPTNNTERAMTSTSCVEHHQQQEVSLVTKRHNNNTRILQQRQNHDDRRTYLRGKPTPTKNKMKRSQNSGASTVV